MSDEYDETKDLDLGAQADYFQTIADGQDSNRTMEKAKKRIRELEQELLQTESVGGRMLKALTEEIDRLRQERDSLRAEVARIKHMSTVEMMCENENVNAHVTEWENRCLKAEAEVERLRLRWQTGPIPEDGIYRLRAIGSNQIGWLDECVDRYIPTDPLLRLLEWAGPIPEPEEE